MACTTFWLRTLGLNINEGLNEFIGIMLISVCTIWSWLRLRPSYSVWITLNWLLINSTAFVLSVPRYALALYTGRFAQDLWAF